MRQGRQENMDKESEGKRGKKEPCENGERMQMLKGWRIRALSVKLFTYFHSRVKKVGEEKANRRKTNVSSI